PHFGEKLTRRVTRMAAKLGIQLCLLETGKDYLQIVKNPSYGYGQNLNPCIDCHLFMVQEAKKLMIKEKASFIFTGEVLGQRPFSQSRQTLALIDRASHLEGYILRPLSALLLPPTRPEIAGWVDRNRLLAIQGKQRKVQFALAEEKQVEDFASPAGGCLLTVPGFCRRLSDLMEHKAEFTNADCLLLQVGRHFRLTRESKLILPRDEGERERLKQLKQPGDTLVSVDEAPGFMGLLQGNPVGTVWDIVASYCPVPLAEVTVRTQRQSVKVSRKPKALFLPWLIK
ncbi:MAG TPA: hypothetical protein PKW42_08735, partial [bacterium]|nr:hypothetical protein [bacterium]